MSDSDCSSPASKSGKNVCKDSSRALVSYYHCSWFLLCRLRKMPLLTKPTSSKDEVSSLMDKHFSENADKPLYLAFFSTVSLLTRQPLSTDRMPATLDHTVGTPLPRYWKENARDLRWT